MITDEQCTDTARSLIAAERERRYLPPLTDAYPQLTVADSYRIAQQVTDIKVSDGAKVIGHKVGLTSAAMRELTGADEPDFGAVFDYWLVDETQPVSRASLNRPMVEIEVAFVLGQALHGSAVTAADVRDATDYVVPSIEIVDSRLTSTGGPARVVVNSVADAASCGLVVLGSRRSRLDDVDLAAVEGRLIINGITVQQGSSSAVMGDPAEAVAWLARKMSEFGAGFDAGHIVLSGSFIRAAPFEAGDVIEADFAAFGSVRIEVTA